MLAYRYGPCRDEIRRYCVMNDEHGTTPSTGVLHEILNCACLLLRSDKRYWYTFASSVVRRQVGIPACYRYSDGDFPPRISLTISYINYWWCLLAATKEALEVVMERPKGGQGYSWRGSGFTFVHPTEKLWNVIPLPPIFEQLSACVFRRHNTSSKRASMHCKRG